MDVRGNSAGDGRQPGVRRKPVLPRIAPHPGTYSGSSIGSAGDSDARSVTTGEAYELGLYVTTLDEIAADEARQLDVNAYEDMTAQHKRYRSRSGTQDACSLPCERDLPAKGDSDGWARYHAARTSSMTGGYDPCNLIR